MRFRHTNKPDLDNVETHWDSQLGSTKGPLRLAPMQTPGQLQQSEYEATCTTFARRSPDRCHQYEKLGGECIHPAIRPQPWSTGDHWNIDSNIRKWTKHEISRNAAGANHDVHRHDQIQRFVLMPQKFGHG